MQRDKWRVYVASGASVIIHFFLINPALDFRWRWCDVRKKNCTPFIPNLGNIKTFYLNWFMFWTVSFRGLVPSTYMRRVWTCRSMELLEPKRAANRLAQDTLEKCRCRFSNSNIKAKRPRMFINDHFSAKVNQFMPKLGQICAFGTTGRNIGRPIWVL